MIVMRPDGGDDQIRKQDVKTCDKQNNSKSLEHMVEAHVPYGLRSRPADLSTDNSRSTIRNPAGKREVPACSRQSFSRDLAVMKPQAEPIYLRARYCSSASARFSAVQSSTGKLNRASSGAW